MVVWSDHVLMRARWHLLDANDWLLRDGGRAQVVGFAWIDVWVGGEVLVLVRFVVFEDH